MNILIGCEFSGIVREAFRAKGHNAWSCDLLPSEKPLHHYQMDLFELLLGKPDWDLMIYHWPCTLLCNSGVRWLNDPSLPTRYIEMEASARDFKKLYDCSVPKVCGENPIPHKYARQYMGKYTQIIQPWMFGHGETKATCLWLKGLPPLKPTNIVEGREPRVHYASPGPNRWKERSRTLQGIANAMAEQWG